MLRQTREREKEREEDEVRYSTKPFAKPSSNNYLFIISIKLHALLRYEYSFCFGIILIQEFHNHSSRISQCMVLMTDRQY